MTAAWMAYALVVGSVVALAAYAMDRVCALANRPARWIWAAAMAFTLVLVMLAPRRDARVTAEVVLPLQLSATEVSAEAAQQTTLELARESVARLRASIETAAASTFAAVGRLTSRRLELSLLAAWALLSTFALVVFFGVHGRVHRARRSWPLTELHGKVVRLAPSAGPAVVGVARPEIVVPRWLLLRSDAEQRMVVAHEAEHLRARDPLLLTVACLMAVLLAWHPAMWWMFTRLRLAMELDCDRRIVRSGIAPRSYGELLIDLADRCGGGMRIGAPALADGSSHLERRLIAMTSPRPKYARTVAGALAACSLVLFALACDAKLPTSEEVNSMNVSAAEGAAKRVALLGAGDSAAVYTIDGRKATAAEAHALTPEQIASIEVVKKVRDGGDETAEHGEIHIVTRKGAPGVRVEGDTAVRVFALMRRDSSALGKGGAASWTASADTITFRASPSGDGPVRVRKSLSAESFNGVLLVNGVRVDNSALATIPPGDIVSVEVVKGDAVREAYGGQYPDSAIANGVIKITTRARTPR